jgi:hypothetical protein
MLVDALVGAAGAALLAALDLELQLVARTSAEAQAQTRRARIRGLRGDDGASLRKIANGRYGARRGVSSLTRNSNSSARRRKLMTPTTPPAPITVAVPLWGARTTRS